jgi:uncharacterized protein YndB with AHSA1/START domain
MTQAMTKKNSKDVFIIERVFDAPREKVVAGLD